MILITGGCGYLGSHCVTSLLEMNIKVCSIDNFSNSSPEVLTKIKSISNNNFEFYEGDIRDEKFINNVFKKNDIDAVIHFAGLKSISESIENPLAYYSNNIAGTINIINIMKSNRVNNIIFSSSATVYGIRHSPPWDETLKLESPSNPYAKSKYMIEEILQNLTKKDKELRVGVLRYFNPIGAHPSGLIGEEILSGSNLVPAILKSIINKDHYLSVYGSDYPTGDGSGIRDYIHVSDLINGHLKALNYIKKNEGFHLWNLGSGSGYSVFEIIQVFEQILKRKIKFNLVDRREGDLSQYWAKIDKAKKELNWIPSKNIEEMAFDTLNYLDKLMPNLRIFNNKSV